MLIAAWRGSRPLQDALWCDLREMVRKHGLTHNERAVGLIASTAPFLPVNGEIAHLSLGLGHELDVHLRNDRLEFSAGTLPQFPLYYRRWTDGLVVVSSHLKVLVDLAPTSLHWRRVVAAASNICESSNETVFSEVHRALGGQRFRINAEGFHTLEQGPEVADRYALASDAQLAGELLTRLRAAVRRTMASARRVAVFAGGGVDSSGLLALALHERDGVEALAQVWSAPGDDAPFLKALEDHFGITAIRTPASMGGKWFARSLSADAQPQLWPGACLDMALWALAQERGADIALSGHAGDEVMGWGISFHTLLAHGHLAHAVAQALRLSVPWVKSPTRRVLDWVIRPVLEGASPRSWFETARRRAHRKRWMRKRYRDLLDASLDTTWTERPSTPDGWFRFWQRGGIFTDRANSWGQVASETHMTAVDIFLQPEIVRFFAEIDPIQRNAEGRFRGLYTMAMTNVLPNVVRLRTTKAAGEPGVAAAAVAGNHLPLLNDLGSFTALADCGLVEPGKLREVFSGWVRRIGWGDEKRKGASDEFWMQVWNLVSTEAFLRTHHGRL